MQRANSFATRLRSHQAVIGTVLTLPCVALAELAADALDFVWIDLEHGALGTADVPPLAVAARAAGAAAIVRLPDAAASRLTAILDAGVDGVVAPRVQSAEEARRLVERLRYPPRGSRGFAARRAGGYGRGAAAGAGGEHGRSAAAGDRPDHGRLAAAATSPDHDLVCMAQIESPEGVAAAAEIAAVDGVDALVVGCADLSLSLDGTLDPHAPLVREAIAQVQRAAAGADIVSGIAGPGDPELLLELAAERSTAFVYSADVRIYAHAVADQVGALRRALARRPARAEEADVRA